MEQTSAPQAPGPEPSLLQRTTSVTSAAVPITVSTDTAHLEDPLQDPKEGWKYRMRRWISRPKVWVLLILIVFAGLSFSPAILSKSKYLGAAVSNDTPNPDADGVGFLRCI